MLDFISTKYPMYAWSFRTLCRRLHYFDIKYIKYEIELENLEESVRKEMNASGNFLLSCVAQKDKRSLWPKSFKEHGLRYDGVR